MVSPCEGGGPGSDAVAYRKEGDRAFGKEALPCCVGPVVCCAWCEMKGGYHPMRVIRPTERVNPRVRLDW